MGNSAILKKIKLKENEEIKEIIRPSLWAYFWQILTASILIILPFFLIYPLFQLEIQGIIIFLVLLIIGLILMLRVYIAYYFTVFIMTNIRIIDMVQKGFFNKSVSSALYDKIQDTYSRSKGILKAMFKLGHVYINISSKRQIKLKLKSIKHPQQVVDKILFFQEDFAKNSSGYSEAELLIKKIKRKLGPEAFKELILD